MTTWHVRWGLGLALLVAGLAAAADPAFINDEALSSRLRDQLEKDSTRKDHVPLSVLKSQLDRGRAVALARPPAAEGHHNPAELYADTRDSVVIFGGLYKCPKCTHWHVNKASGFAIATNALVTNYHVMDSTNATYQGAMTADGRFYRVLEVLAADEKADVAILRVDGPPLAPLPLRADAPVGAPVAVISHVDGRCYTLTTGIISRYFYEPSLRRFRSTGAERMAITADYAKGSSGGPVLDEAGNVVGMVCSTHSIYYDEAKDDNLQMVIKSCVPAVSLLRLLK